MPSRGGAGAAGSARGGDRGDWLRRADRAGAVGRAGGREPGGGKCREAAGGDVARGRRRCCGRYHGGPRSPGASGAGYGRPGAGDAGRAAGLRPRVYLLRHTARQGAQPLAPRRAGGVASARGDRRGDQRVGADRCRSGQLPQRRRPARRPGPGGVARGPRTAAPAPLVHRPGGDRRRALARARRGGAADAASASLDPGGLGPDPQAHAAAAFARARRSR